MPQYHAYVNILPLPDLLDPQGKATKTGLHQLGYTQVSDVRVGKRIRLTLAATNPAEAQAQAEAAAKALLANPLVETFAVEPPQPVADEVA